MDATDTTQLLGLYAARAALDDAGYGPGSGRDYDHSKVGVILGVTGTLELVIPLGARLGHPIWRRALKAAGVAQATADDVVRRISESYVGWQENSFPGLLGNVAAGRIANRLDLGGTNCVIDAACASSLGALDLALHELATRRADMVLSGGLDTFNDIFMYMCFSKTPALSPSGDARPFDAGGDGTILGEGLGVVVLKRLDDARRDGDRVYAVIRAVGSSSDGKGGAVYAPSAAGQARALRRAYALAGVSPATVELVEAHGTGTKVGDATELTALAEVYREADREGSWCALGSVKSQIGHTKAAAGAAGLIKAALALYHKVLPPTIKVTRPIEGAEPGRSPFYVNTELRPWLPRGDHPRRAAVSAFGFGGSNFHCVLEEAEPALPGIDWDGDVQIIALSADRPDALLAALDGLPRDLAWEALRGEAARSRASFRAGDACRLLLVVDRETTDLGRIAAKARALVAAGRSSAAEGIFVGSGPAAGGLAMLFPGQGSQYVGMLRELACRFPMVHAALAEAHGVALDDGRGLGDLIYPHPAFSDDERARHEAALRATAVAQPALGALSLGILGILDHFGVQPASVAGHSFGELTALYAAGRIDALALGRLARSRGRLMAGPTRAGGNTPGHDNDRGAMLAVMAPLDRIAAALRDDKLDLVIANKNAPDQAVLSGPTAEIARAARRFEEQGIRTRTLEVSGAFHSRFVAAARGPFAETLRAVPMAAARVPVYANATGALYPDDPEAARALLAEQLVRPVEFVAEIEAMYGAGIRTFLEVGPDRKLTALVGAILGGRAPAALAVDPSRGQRGNLADLARALAQLAALGHPVLLPLWDDGADHARTNAMTARKPGLTVKVCGANPAPKTDARPKDPAREPLPSGGLSRDLAGVAERNSGSPAPGLRDMTPATHVQRSDSSPVPRATALSNSNRDAFSPMTPTTSERFNQPRIPPANGNGDSTAHPGPGRNGAALEQGHAVVHTPGAPIPALRSNDPALLAQALRTAQDNLVALQKLGEQTAQLHRQFLDGQDRTRRTFQTLLEQQQRLVLASLGLESVTTPSSLVGEGRGRGDVEPRQPRTPHPGAAEAGATPSRPPQGERVAEAARIQAVLTAIVAEKTGYPAEMLEPAMRLDADLGIDSIKRVEILSALQEQLPDAPVIKPEHLGTLQTLGQIVEFLAAGAAAADATLPLPRGEGARRAGEGLGRSVEESARIQAVLTAIVAEKTGYPAEMLEPAMQLDADLGIDSIKRVEILSALQEQLPDAPVIKPEHLGTLQTLGQIVEFLAAEAGATPRPPHPSPTLPLPRGEGARRAGEGLGGGRVKEPARIQAVLTAIVAEKTGYPAEMLEPTMRLDADLGIDSIKRVEILSALQEQLPDAPVIKPEHLGTLQTLGQIVEFLATGEAEAGAIPCPPHPGPTLPLPRGEGARRAGEGLGGRVEEPAVPLQRLVLTSIPLDDARRPREPVRLRPGSAFWICDDGDGNGLALALADRLRAWGHDARVLRRAEVGLQSPPARLDGLLLLAPSSGCDDATIKDAFRLLRTAGPGLRQAGREGCAVLATVTRLDGAFGTRGLGLDSQAEPVSGGLAGLAKTAGHEWPEVACKAIDIEPDFVRGDMDRAVEAILDELLLRGPAEVGLARDGRSTLELVPTALAGGVSTLDPGDVVVISGGARGITAEVALALAAALRPTIVLLGRSPGPAPEPDWLAALDIADEAAIKRGLAARANGQATPQSIGEQFRGIAAGREIFRNLGRIESAGAKVVYRAVDVRDGAAVAACLAAVRHEHGPIRGLVHGAGVLADRRIEDQTDAQFAAVYDTKVSGLRSLLAALRPEADDLRLLVLFSSSTARFGRTGQVAYAAANEVMNKWAQREAVNRPGRRVVSVNWGPWEGGMVTPCLLLSSRPRGSP